MSTSLRFASAASLAALATVLAGCVAPQGKVASASHFGGKAAGDIGLATRALAALNANDVPLAVSLAERAVAKTPQDAGFRALLGNAYFAAGRFRSAEQAFRDSLTIYSNQPEVVLKLALVQIALGKNADALAFLNAGRAVLSPSNYGLALALAGETREAVAVLEAAARGPGADPTVRQNLALAYAFAGDWTQARTVAAQDVPASQLDARLQQWMQLAKPARPSDQVAALVGVTPAAIDHGQPVQLALSPGATRQAEAAPAPAPFASPQPQMVEAAPPPPPLPQAYAAVEYAPPPPPVRAVAPAPPPPRESALVSIASAAVGKARDALAAVAPARHSAAKPAASVTVKLLPARPVTARRGESRTVVQLGAYGSPQRVLAAWDSAARKHSALRAYMPVSARFESPKGVFYRLAVKGFDNPAEAQALCTQLRRSGGSCFVRGFAGDAPVRIASL